MNENRFRLFFVYAIDLHNLKFNGQLSSSHPRIAAPICQSVNNDLVAALKDMTLNQDADKAVSEKQLSCDVCGKNFKSQSGMTRHMKTVHPDKNIQPENMLQCDLCTKYRKSVSGLTRHKKSHM